MSFNWADYKTLAENLHNNPDTAIDEASHRSAISRAYYAAFHVTKQKMVDKYKYYPGLSGDTHKELLEFLRKRKATNSNFEEVWNNLKSLKSQRISADYDAVYDFEGQNVERSSSFAIEYCKKIFEAVSKLRQRSRKGSSST